MRAILRAIANVLRLPLWPLWMLARRAGARGGPWVQLRLSTRLTEFRTPEPLWRRLLVRSRALRPTSLEDVRQLARALAADAAVQGLLVHVPPLEAGFAACESVRRILLDLRAAGKQVVCYLPRGGGNRELYVALAAERVVAGPFTSFSPLGLGSHALYLKRLLDRVGVRFEVQACGQYKSAAEPLVREDMSEAAREQMQALLGSLHAGLAAALRARFAGDESRVQAVFARGLLTARAAVELGLVDEVAYEDELALRWLGSDDARFVPAARYLAARRARFFLPVRAQPYIAIVPVRGTIVSDSVTLGRTTASLRAVVTALREVARDEKAQAVVLYVNSPGGSALASELIHREVERLCAHKPVVACFGDVAASGGYYIAAPCRRIVAQPSTLTGSIGVVSAKVVVDGLVARLGVHAPALRTAPHADMFSPLRPLEPAERAMIGAHARELYDRFVQVVAAGRKKTPEEIEPLAQGRVWSGRDAHERGLVDVLGGLEQALDEARALVPHLGEAERERLQPRVHVVRKPEGPVPEPIAGAEAWLEALPIVRECAALFWAVGAQEPALFYAPDVSSLR